MDDARTVSELGEEGLLARIAAAVETPAGDELYSGDDAAVVRAPGDRIVFTTDVMVERVDFDLSYFQGADVGWKAIAVNVSDIAAMAGRPSHAVVALSLRPDTLVSVFDGVFEGIVEAARRWGLAIVGGDISSADDMSVSVAALGSCDGDPVLRSGARPGHALCVTGHVGGAAGGLHALRRGLAGPGPTEGRALSPELAAAVEALARRQLRPQARVPAASVVAARGAAAMIDVSDGLGIDLARLLDAGGVGCEVEASAVPVDPALGPLAAALGEDCPDPFALAMAGGEDFELLVAMPEDGVEAARAALEDEGTPLTRIGTVTDGEARVDGEPLQRWKEKGWGHLLGR